MGANIVSFCDLRIWNLIMSSAGQSTLGDGGKKKIPVETGIRGGGGGKEALPNGKVPL
jgi:hypothetical protein